MMNLMGSELMYDHEQLTNKIDDYMESCQGKPTKRGLSSWLGISDTTVYNVLNGRFNGFIYTRKPHINRAIDNPDFGLIRSIFTAERKTE